MCISHRYQAKCGDYKTKTKKRSARVRHQDVALIPLHQLSRTACLEVSPADHARPSKKSTERATLRPVFLAIKSESAATEKYPGVRLIPYILTILDGNIKSVWFPHQSKRSIYTRTECTCSTALKKRKTRFGVHIHSWNGAYTSEHSDTVPYPQLQCYWCATSISKKKDARCGGGGIIQ